MTESDRTAEAPYLFIASMDVASEHEMLFNEVYDTEHLPALARVPGVLGAGRYERVEFEMSLDGAIQRVSSGKPRYHAVYRLESPEVLTGRVWAEAVEFGRWPSEVRPYTMNRQHLLTKRLPRAAGSSAWSGRRDRSRGGRLRG